MSVIKIVGEPDKWNANACGFDVADYFEKYPEDKEMFVDEVEDFVNSSSRFELDYGILWPKLKGKYFLVAEKSELKNYLDGKIMNGKDLIRETEKLHNEWEKYCDSCLRIIFRELDP